MVFHSPQVSHLPAHFAVTAPQDWQTNRGEDLAMARSVGLCGKVTTKRARRAAYTNRAHAAAVAYLIS
jgi:hypothetical protein